VASGRITTVAGGPGGPAKAATVSLGPLFSAPCGVSYGAGALYIADRLTVRKVAPGGWLTTLAGSDGDGTPGSGPLGDGGPATRAFLTFACGVATDRSGNLVVADLGTSQIRMVAVTTGTFYGQPMTAGNIYTIAGTGTAGFSGDGGPAVAAELDRARNLALDGAGNLLIADQDNSRIRVVAATTGTFYGQPMTAGDIYTVAGGGTSSLGDGGPATAAQLGAPAAVAVDHAGNLLIADTYNRRIRVVAAGAGSFYGQPMTAGDIYTIAGNGTAGFAGDGGPALGAELDDPFGLALDGQGNVLMADFMNNRIRVVATSTGTFYGQAMTAGDIYTIAGGGTSGLGDGGPATAAEIFYPTAVATDAAGNVAIADQQNGRVRVVAATTGRFYGQAMTAGNIYTIAGTGVRNFSGDGGPATAAEFSSPAGVASGGAAGMAIAEPGDNRVQVVAASTGTFFGQAMTARHIYTVAGDGATGFAGDGGPGAQAELNSPQGVVFDQAGNLVIADTGNNRIRVVAAATGSWYGQAMTAGHIYPISPTPTPLLFYPEGVAADHDGNLVIADTGASAMLVLAARTGTFYGQVMTAGHVYQVAGGGTSGLGDGGPATRAVIGSPAAVAIDQAGNLVITDTGNNRIRVVAASTGSFYGQQMTAGYIYTVAGNSTAGFSGDGGPATSAGLLRPGSVTVDGSGNLVIADTSDNRIRVVAASTGSFYGQPMTAGNIYTVAGTGTGGFSGDGGPATSGEIAHPQGVAATPAGDLIIADTYANRVRLVTG
jgi:sugar lactone lactonase YvrE